MDEIMAEQKQQEELQQENEVLDKKQLKAAKKLEKRRENRKIQMIWMEMRKPLEEKSLFSLSRLLSF
ncbi:hypothetical protein ROSEINA2194_00948 [Roseburia inulinivorans DSM 16841]|uniref:Uncharacterized protein n=1 Tax=Roseburia inulinivorans DSM 16841 TaxID=622312 RepID=C0FQE4_9FIRM|nr:hypothetical protein [Roseburia inulinivorans]EEG95166.1 hypothetical protein ROSEINA2194_00948 [Roseburia inulinivorans DSM 16841]